ncbi:hypothetical protein CRUP_013931, partial [Coryphaenoides rupestris]
MSGCYCKSLYPFSGDQHQQGLTFEAGDRIKIVQAPTGGWWEGEKDGATGWFPSSYVQVLESDPTRAEMERVPGRTLIGGTGGLNSATDRSDSPLARGHYEETHASVYKKKKKKKKKKKRRLTGWTDQDTGSPTTVATTPGASEREGECSMQAGVDPAQQACRATALHQMQSAVYTARHFPHR